MPDYYEREIDVLTKVHVLIALLAKQLIELPEGPERHQALVKILEARALAIKAHSMDLESEIHA